MALQPQAALETAVRNAIRTSLEYPDAQCQRTHAGMPHPRAGNVFVSVWYDGQRDSEMRTCLNEVFGVYVTVTVRAVQPFDRWVIHRDDLEARLNAIKALLHADSYNFAISRAAAVLAEFDGTGQAVGFREALWFRGFDAVQEVGPDWFSASIDGPNVPVGLAQRARFGGARRVQALATMS